MCLASPCLSLNYSGLSHHVFPDKVLLRKCIGRNASFLDVQRGRGKPWESFRRGILFCHLSHDWKHDSHENMSVFVEKQPQSHQFQEPLNAQRGCLLVTSSLSFSFLFRDSLLLHGRKMFFLVYGMQIASSRSLFPSDCLLMNFAVFTEGGTLSHCSLGEPPL